MLKKKSVTEEADYLSSMSTTQSYSPTALHKTTHHIFGAQEKLRSHYAL